MYNINITIYNVYITIYRIITMNNYCDKTTLLQNDSDSIKKTENLNLHTLYTFFSLLLCFFYMYFAVIILSLYPKGNDIK